MTRSHSVEETETQKQGEKGGVLCRQNNLGNRLGEGGEKHPKGVTECGKHNSYNKKDVPHRKKKNYWGESAKKHVDRDARGKPRAGQFQNWNITEGKLGKGKWGERLAEVQRIVPY